MANVVRAGRGFEERRRRIKERHPVCLSALWALREAIHRERYEDCPDIIAVAKEFGAGDQEIHYLLEDSRREP